MKRKTLIIISLLILSMVAIAGAWGDDIKARMHARLGDIVELKARGVVGENNQGYLTVLKGPTGKQAVIDAENKDRGIIYRAIAKKQGTTAKLVGQRRALKIAQKADAGTMIQSKGGAWMKK